MQTSSIALQTNNTDALIRNQEIVVKGSEKQQIKDETQDSLVYGINLQETTVIQAIEKANKKLMGETLELNFSIHEKTKQILVKIVDKSTKEVVREIPSEKILDMVASMCEAAGLFVDKKV